MIQTENYSARVMSDNEFPKKNDEFLHKMLDGIGDIPPQAPFELDYTEFKLTDGSNR